MYGIFGVNLYQVLEMRFESLPEQLVKSRVWTEQEKMLALSIYRVYLESGQKGAMSPLEHVLQIDLLASQMLMWSCIFFILLVSYMSI